MNSELKLEIPTENIPPARDGCNCHKEPGIYHTEDCCGIEHFINETNRKIAESFGVPSKLQETDQEPLDRFNDTNDIESWAKRNGLID